MTAETLMTEFDPSTACLAGVTDEPGSCVIASLAPACRSFCEVDAYREGRDDIPVDCQTAVTVRKNNG